MTARCVRFFIWALYGPLLNPPPFLCLKACPVQKVTFQNLLSFPTLHFTGLNVSMPVQSPMLAACSFLPNSAPTWSICWSFIIAMFIFYMSPIISLIWGLILTVVALREGFQKICQTWPFGWTSPDPCPPPNLGPIIRWYCSFKSFLSIKKLT